VPASAGLLVEVSDAWVGLKLHGAGALEVLGSACRMDCASMAIDCVALTSLHQVRVLLIRRGADWFELLVPRSYAEDMIESIMNPGPE
jgi:heterotetrameric sarcosine oxidase gamma subunit